MTDMAENQKTIFVYENWSNLNPILMGRLFVDYGRGKEHVSFEYDDKWLKQSNGKLILDPDLALYRGRQYSPIDKTLFGLFSDSCPDRWGRHLMQRKEAINARNENRKPRTLLETDYLLGVFDESRMGALRFSLEENGEFLSSEKELATPPWVRLRQLQSASWAFENDENGTDEKWLSQLLAPGSSLGGARPKATVQDVNGHLWIAKFPSKNDETNSGAWEKVVHDLAGSCGLNIPESKLENFSKTGSTFLVKRFDREGTKRIHFSSAMTLLGKVDGVEDASYLDMVSFIKSYGSNPKQDLKELWSRIAFNLMVSNTDDHLRNHGFILNKNGWNLSPLYDVNPTPYGDALSLNISQNDNSMSTELLLETAKYYLIKQDDAHKILKKMSQVVDSGWKQSANKYGLTRKEIEYMQPAFFQSNITSSNYK